MRHIDACLDQFLENYQIPGIGVGICLNNEIVYQKVKGISDTAKGAALSLDSIFPMASISKVFSATAGMQLVQNKQIDLNDSLLRYLPGFVPDDARYADINLQHILSHTSGIADLSDYDWLNPRYDDDAAAAYLNEIKPVPLIAEPGNVYQYSNRAYNILGQLVKSVAGDTLEEYIRKNIFLPLGMHSSTFLYGEVPAERRVSPHTIGKGFEMRPRNVYPYNRIHAPSSTLHSTIPDMMQWIKLWLNEGRLNGTRILERQYHDQMLLPYVETEPDAYMCLGWKMLVRRGLTFFVSVGGAPGFRSFLVLVPGKKAGIIVVHNSDIVTAENISISILLLLLGLNFRLPLPPLHMKLGKWIMEDGLESGLEKYHSYKQACPDQYDFDPSYLVSLGYILLHKFHLPHEAIAIFEKGLRENPQLWKAYNGMGEAYMRLGQTQNGIRSFSRSLEINAANPVAIGALKEQRVYTDKAGTK